MALLVVQPVPDPEVEAEVDLRVPPTKVAYNLRSRKNRPKGEGEPNERTPLLRKVLNSSTVLYTFVKLVISYTNNNLLYTNYICTVSFHSV